MENIKKAQSNAMAWKKMIQNNSEKNESAKSNLKVFKNNMKDLHHDLNVIQHEEISNNIKNQDFKMESESNYNERIVNRSDKVSGSIYNLNNMNFSKACKKK